MSDFMGKSPAAIAPSVSSTAGSEAEISISVKQVRLISLCYQLFLGRLPEDEKIIRARKSQKLEELIKELIKSTEFKEWAATGIFRQKTLFTNVLKEDIKNLFTLLNCGSSFGPQFADSFSYEAVIDRIILLDKIVGLDPALIGIRAEYFADHSLNAKETLPENVLLNQESKDILQRLFDLSYYNKAVKRKFDNLNNAIDHYLSLEVEERQDPTQFFDRTLYLALYPSVQTFRLDPLVHYICIGQFKDYNPHPLFDVKTVKSQMHASAVSARIYLEFLSDSNQFADIQFHSLVDIYYVRKQMSRNASSREIFTQFLGSNVRLTINPTPLFDVDYYRASGGCINYNNALVDYVVARPDGANVHPLFDTTYYCMNVDGDLGGRVPLQHYLENWQAFPGDVNFLIDAKYLNHQLSISSQSEVFIQREPLGYLLQHKIDFCGPLFHPHVDMRVLGSVFSNLLNGISTQGEQLAAILLSLPKLISSSRRLNPSVPAVSVIILNYCKPVYSAVCIMAVLNAFRGIEIEVIFIENGGESYHFELLTKMFSGYCKFIAKKFTSNKYFGEANNIGCDLASGPYILFLNNDCFLFPDFGDATMSLIHEGGHDAVGALLMYPDGKIQEFGGLVADDGQVIQRAKGVPADFLQSPAVNTVEYASAACFLISRRALDVVVGFDPVFEPFYYEDTDLCRRLRLSELTLSVSSRLKAIHIENASTREYLAEAEFQKMVGEHRSLYARRWLRNSGEGAYTRKLSTNHEVNNDVARPTAVIYTPYGIRPGGGERYVFSAGRALSTTHRILICSPEPFSRARVSFLLNSLNIEQFAFDVCDLSHLALSAPQIDIWFVMANELVTSMPARGRVNIYHLQFPFPWRNTNAFQFDLLSSYDVIIVNSEFTHYWTMRRLAEIGFLGSPPVEIVYPPIKSLSRRRVKEKCDTLRIVTIGRFFVGGHSKRQDVFVEILSAVRKLTSQKISGVILGSVHASIEAQNYFESVKTSAEDVGDLQVITEASNQEILEHLSEADVYVHCTGYGVPEAVWPERAEHFGITIIEAVQSGCIPLVYGIGGPAEIMQHSKAGLTFKSIDEAAGLLVQLSDEKYRAKLLNAVDWKWVDRTSEASFDERLLSIVQSLDPANIQDRTAAKRRGLRKLPLRNAGRP